MKLPPYIYGHEAREYERVWTEDAVRQAVRQGVDEALAAERAKTEDAVIEAFERSLALEKTPVDHEYIESLLRVASDAMLKDFFRSDFAEKFRASREASVEHPDDKTTHMMIDSLARVDRDRMTKALNERIRENPGRFTASPLIPRTKSG